MIEIPDVVLCSPESVCLMDDEFCFVIHPFNGAVVDGHPEVIENVAFVATHHPSEVAHRGEPRMGGPPEPLFEVTLVQNRLRLKTPSPESWQ